MPSRRIANAYYTNPSLGQGFQALAGIIAGDGGEGLSRDVANYASARARDAEAAKTAMETSRIQDQRSAVNAVGPTMDRYAFRTAEEPMLTDPGIGASPSASPRSISAGERRASTAEEQLAMTPELQALAARIAGANPEKLGALQLSLSAPYAPPEAIQRNFVGAGHNASPEFSATPQEGDRISARNAGETYRQAMDTNAATNAASITRESMQQAGQDRRNAATLAAPSESRVKAGILTDIVAGKDVPEAALRAVGGARNTSAGGGTPMFRAISQATREAGGLNFDTPDMREQWIETRAQRIMDIVGGGGQVTPAAQPVPGAQPATAPAPAAAPGPTADIPPQGPTLKGDLSVNEAKEQRGILASGEPLLADIKAVKDRLSVGNTGVAGASQRLYNSTVGAATGSNWDQNDAKTMAILAGIKTRVQAMLKVDTQMGVKERGDLEALAQTVDITKGLDQVIAQLDEVERLAGNRIGVARQRLTGQKVPLVPPGATPAADSKKPREQRIDSKGVIWERGDDGKVRPVGAAQ